MSKAHLRLPGLACHGEQAPQHLGQLLSLYTATAVLEYIAFVSFWEGTRFIRFIYRNYILIIMIVKQYNRVQ